jgi:hypothetical protein
VIHLFASAVAAAASATTAPSDGAQSASDSASSAAASAATSAAVGISALEWLRPPSHWPATVDVLNWCQNMAPGTAALLVGVGIVYLLFGYYSFKALIMLNAALFGAAVGAYIGSRGGAEVAGALMGAFIAAAITWPLMKFAVAVMGGVVGAAVGASIWRACGLEPQFAWAGGMSGLIFFGMLSFILFRGSIMMYTSLQGSVMVIFGMLGLIYKYNNLAPAITAGMTAKSFVLPATIFVPAVVGMIYQHTQTSPATAGEGKKK